MHAASDHSTESRHLDDAAPRAARIAGGVGVAGLVVAVVFGFIQQDWSVFFRSYLLNYAYVMSMVLAALFFVMLQHLTRAGWSVAVRRLAENVAGAMPLMAVAFLPLLIPVVAGMGGVYEWADPHYVEHDASGLLAHKQPYLNMPFFIVRCAIYFVIWLLLARFFVRESIAQDADGDVRHTERMQWWSAPGMLLYALTVTFFSVDTLMSLNPHWYSTIWGVYYFSGGVVGFFALLAIMIYLVQASGRLTRSVTIEHFHDVGKLAFAFVVFWAYIAFSQYVLIWYANIPEETAWYRVRQDSAWWVGVSVALLVGHFFAPFLALISRHPKRHKAPLTFAAVWLLVVHWLDLYYIVIPHPPGHGHGGAPLHVTDFALLVGLGGLLAFAILRNMGRASLLPERDPRLRESLAFENI